MKNYRFIKILFIFILVVFMGNVKAFNQSISSIGNQGNAINHNGYDWLELKYYGNTAVFCTQFLNQNLPSDGSTTCNLTNNWSDAVKAGVASIIKNVGEVNIQKIKDNGGNAPTNYYYGELAINEFLCDSKIDTHYTCVSSNRTHSEVLGSYDKWFTAAQAVRDSYKNASLKFSSGTLTFSKSGDYYNSNTIEITKSFDDNFSLTSTHGEIVRDGNKFYVKVPVSSISAGSSVEVRVTSSISKTVDLAQNYDCGDKQSLTPNLVEAKTLSDSASASGTISVPEEVKGTLTINKLDGNGAPLSGATIKITGPNNYSVTKTTTGEAIVLTGLELGKYTITETTAPAGYIKGESQTVTLSKTNLTELVDIKNEQIEISILKVDASGTAISGANLQLQDKEGNVIELNGKKLEWTSTKSSYTIKGLPSGTYSLTETSAPAGYNKLKKAVKIVIADNGKVTVDGKENATGVIKLKNDIIETIISKITIVDGKELPGATLQILNDKKEKMSCTILDEEGKKKKLDECSWVSGENPVTVLGLSIGKYYLVEIMAPEGYEKNETEIEFEVKDDGTVTEVTMENALKVDVPDTLSSRSVLLLAMAMFDIALGIGILVYVKNNKIKE